MRFRVNRDAQNSIGSKLAEPIVADAEVMGELMNNGMLHNSGYLLGFGCRLFDWPLV